MNIVIIGAGKIGVGTGKAKEVPEAIEKATLRAKKNMISVAVVDNTIPHQVLGRFGRGAVLMMPAAEGTGVIAGGPVRIIMEAAGIKTFIFVPERAPQGKVAQLMIFGANVISVKGNYEETFKMSAEAIEKWGWYNRNAAINPYLSEGKKTVSLEIAEQLNWEMPDYLAISVGDGCTIAGVWKGLKDLYAIGFIDKLPRLISAQSTGCYPINRAIQENKPWEPMEENTIADSISVGVPRNADKALMAIRESNGIAVNVTDEEILAAQKLLGRTCGVFGEPAGVTGTAAVKKACEQGLIEKGATVVSVVTGNGLKDVANAIKSAGEPINIKPDLDLMVEEFAKRGVTVE